MLREKKEKKKTHQKKVGFRANKKTKGTKSQDPHLQPWKPEELLLTTEKMVLYSVKIPFHFRVKEKYLRNYKGNCHPSSLTEKQIRKHPTKCFN